MGDRRAYLAHAVELVEQTCGPVVAESTIYTSKALLTQDAPPEWDVDFLNMAVLVETALAPQALLRGAQDIERTVGRTARKEQWAPREIDVDILAYGEEVVHDGELVIPHPHLTERTFAMVPFAEVWAEWVHPELKETAEALAARFADAPREEFAKTAL